MGASPRRASDLREIVDATADVIEWNEPLPVRTPDATGLACRRCVAAYGLKAPDVGKLPQTREEFDVHLAQFHADEVNDGR